MTQRWRAVVLLALFALAAPRVEAGPFVWKVEGRAAVHYLAGSVHMLPAAAHPMPAELDAAWAATRGLVLEADLDELVSAEFQTTLLAAAIEQRPGGIEARIGRPLYTRLQRQLAALGLPGPICDNFRPWFCAMTVELLALQRAGFSPEFGVDQVLFKRAQEDGREILGLETARQQMDLFAGLSEELSTAMLAATLGEMEAGHQDPEALHRMWRQGDLAALEEIVAAMAKDFPRVHARLLADRNRAWLAPLDKLLAGETPQLVVVGAAHLAGKDGLLALLRARGLRLTPACGGTPGCAGTPPGP